ncbi:MAG: Rap1a/Tai family immunity protein, partial [Xanthobacteraceae bacterium]
YIEGVADMMLFIGTGVDQYPETRMFAICSDATYGAAVQAFKNWAEQNPREWQKPKLIGVMIALKTNWDCPQK